MKKIVIASLSYFYPKKASTETYLEVIAKGFRHEDVHVVALSNVTEDRVGKWGEKIHLIDSNHKINIPYIGTLNPLIWSAMILQKLMELKPDVVITGEIHITGMAASVYSKLTGTKSIITVTGDYEQEKHGWWKGSKIGWFYRLLYDSMEQVSLQFATKFVANGRHMQEKLIMKGITEDRAILSFGCTEPDRFVRDEAVRKAMRKKLRVDGKKVLCFIGNFLDRDGIMEAVGILGELFKKDKDYHIIVLGAGPLERPADSLARTLGLNDNIHWMGWVHHEKVKDFLMAADLTIFPMKEPQCGLSMAALESLALGVPLITSNVADMKEIILEGHTGFVAGGTVDSFVSWVEKFFSLDSEMKLMMSGCSRQLVIEKFSDVRMNEDFRRVIDGDGSSC